MPVALKSVPFAVIVALVVGEAAAAPPAPSKEECIAASESAQDLRNAGKLLDGRAKFTLCVAESCPGAVREDCADRLKQLAAALPSVVFEIKDSAGSDVPSAKVTMDGQRLAAIAGTAVELDPGEHTFVFEAVGLTKVEKTLVVVEGVKQRREVIQMARAKTLELTTSTPLPLRDEAPPPRSNGLPPLGWAAFGVGGTGLAVGLIAGLVATGKHSTLSGECNDAAGTCAPQYAGDLDAFHSWRTVSTVGYVVGVLGAAGGVTLWLTAPKAQATTAHVWFGPGSAGIAGRF